MARIIKTVLAPNAPWIPKSEQVKKPKPKPKPRKSRSQPSKTDLKFEEWLKNNEVKTWIKK